MGSPARLRPFGRAFVPVATGHESAAFDRWAIDEVGVPQPTLMENAGRGAARVLARLYARGPVVGVVGAGNNGGDALVALRALAEWGREVRALIVADRPSPEVVLHGWPVECVPVLDSDDPGWEALGGAAVVIDGVLGTGLSGPPRPRQSEAIRRINACHRPVLSLDVPSGVAADDGAVPGEAVRAAVTVSFGAPKLGTLLHPGRARAGRIVVLDIGFPPLDGGRFTARLITPAWAEARRPVRALDTHKKAVGVLLLVAGGAGMAGAAVLAARGALRAGVGLLRVASAGCNREIVQTAVPAAVFVDADDSAALAGAVSEASAVAVGPGLGTGAWATAAMRAATGAGDVPLVLDADALNLVAAGAVPPPRELAAGRPVLVTPHPGEMARLLAAEAHGAADGPASRVEAARAWSRRTGCVLLLKGAPSLVAAGDAPVLIDGAGSSDLATAGMGDVLTGVAGALLAQGVPAREAAGLALHLSGRAARLSTPGAGLLPDDVAERLPWALLERGPGHSDLDAPDLVFDQDAPR